MIEILPMEDRNAEQELLNALPQRQENARILRMTEGEKVLGWVALDLCGNTLRMLEFQVTGENKAEQDFFLDSLMRSAASYGEIKGADQLTTIDARWNGFLKQRGFHTDETHAWAPMSLIVHYE